MNTALLILTLFAVAPAGGPDFKGRERHPLAPSLPLLTEKEQQAVEKVIDRLIEADVGKVKGAAGAKAHADFKALGPEAIPALLDGLNRAANMEASCPAVLIAKKLAQLLSASDDTELLDFARENIGAGVTAKRHTVVLKDLKVTCILRKATVQRGKALAAKGGAGGGEKPPRSMSVGELAAAAGSERGPRLEMILAELGRRPGDKAVEALGAAASSYDGKVRQAAREALAANLGRQSAAALKRRLKDDRAEVRLAAVRTVSSRGLRFGAELIELLTDQEAEVAQAARQALVRLSRGQDFGPAAGASEEDSAAAVRRWRGWWAKQGAS
jgi:hypothetical protein